MLGKYKQEISIYSLISSKLLKPLYLSDITFLTFQLIVYHHDINNSEKQSSKKMQAKDVKVYQKR